MIWKFLKQNVLFPKGLNWVQHWVSRIGLLNNNNNNNNKLINEAGSLCSSDSVEEENEIEEQSGRPIQRQIPQPQRGKAETIPFENNLSTASFPLKFFIHLSLQTAHMSCDFPLVYWKLH